MTTLPDFTAAQQVAWNQISDVSPFWGRQIGPPPFTSVGLTNVTGSSCYQLSLLQCILHAPQFINWLEKHREGWPERERAACGLPDCIACSLSDLSTLYWQRSKYQIEVDREAALYRDRHWRAGWDLDGDQDAHELYTHLIQEIRNQCHQDDALLRALFTMELTSTLTCPSCSHQSSSSVLESCLICSFTRRGRLLDLIRTNFTPETISDYRCPNCQDNSPRQRLQVINVPPEILVIQLNRFSYVNGSKRKKKDIISIPEEIDLSTFCEGSKSFKYRAFAVIKHRGTLNTGHYISYTQGPGGRWELINDYKVSRSTIDEALDSKNNFLPYMIFYKKDYGNDRARSWGSSSWGSVSEESPSVPSMPPPSDAASLLVSHKISGLLPSSVPETEPKLPSPKRASPATSKPPTLKHSLKKLLSRPLTPQNSLKPTISKSPTPRHSPRRTISKSPSPRNSPNPQKPKTPLSPSIIKQATELARVSPTSSHPASKPSPKTPSPQNDQEASTTSPSVRFITPLNKFPMKSPPRSAPTIMKHVIELASVSPIFSPNPPTPPPQPSPPQPSPEGIILSSTPAASTPSPATSSPSISPSPTKPPTKFPSKRSPLKSTPRKSPPKRSAPPPPASTPVKRRPKRIPKYLVPEHPTRVQPDRACRGRVERPVREPRRKRAGDEAKGGKGPVKTRKDGVGKKGSGRSRRRG